ncbi:MAG: YihY/virulence factor BrkB family protein [Bacteroidetes bacterium]|nr:MAG: YihY/virulence factor BrkB family protein [Bacteroidota bacterium]
MGILRFVYRLFRDAILKFTEDKAFKHGAAISYYTIFSLPAILIIIINLAGMWLGEEAVKEELLNQIDRFIGPDSARQIAAMITGLRTDNNSFWATLLGIGTLIFGATGVFYTLQDSLNTLWRIPDKLKGGSWLKLILDRVLSLAMVFTLGFILLVSMVLQTLIVAINTLIRNLSESFVELMDEMAPGFSHVVRQIDFIFWTAYSLDLLVTLTIITLVFALIFRFLPAARLRWRDVWLGSFLTAVLFTIGRALISWYIGNSNITSTYGAAGSIVLILAWVFYSSLIFLLGAELIYVYCDMQGREIQPARFVVSITDQPLRRLRLAWLRLLRRWRRWQARRNIKAEVSSSPKPSQSEALPTNQEEKA